MKHKILVNLSSRRIKKPNLGTRDTVLRPGIVSISRQSGRSRFHITEVLRGNRDASPELTAIIHKHGLEVPK